MNPYVSGTLGFGGMFAGSLGLSMIMAGKLDSPESGPGGLRSDGYVDRTEAIKAKAIAGTATSIVGVAVGASIAGDGGSKAFGVGLAAVGVALFATSMLDFGIRHQLRN